MRASLAGRGYLVGVVGGLTVNLVFFFFFSFFLFFPFFLLPPLCNSSLVLVNSSTDMLGYWVGGMDGMDGMGMNWQSR